MSAKQETGAQCIHFPRCGCGGSGIVDSACWPISPPPSIGRIEISLDGSHACALLGADLQSGEAEFAPIESWPNATYKQERAAMSAAYEMLAARLGKRPPFDIVREHATPPSSTAVKYERAPALDRRIAHGDDFAGDAWVRWTAVGHSPDDAAPVSATPAQSRYGTMICYTPCKLHEGVAFNLSVGYCPPMKQVCPICEPPSKATDGGAKP